MEKNMLQRLGYFYAVFIPFAVAGCIALLLTGKGELFLWMNQWRHPALDYFFRTVTWLGSGISFALVCLYYVLTDLRKGFLALLCFTVSSVLAQLLKKMVFPHIVRPMKFFEDPSVLHTVSGFKNSLHFSFPSGHTASIFSLAVFLALVLPGKKWGIALALIAIITGISRIYLVQHFFEDVYAGAWLGVLSTMLVFFAFEKWFYKKESLNRPLFRR